MTTAPNTAMLTSANLNVEDRNALARSTDTKPDAANGVDQRISLLAVDLAAHATDIDVDDVGRGIEMQIPDMLQQHRPRHHVALVADQIFKHLEFARQQLDRPAAAIDRAGDEVELEVADAQDRLLDHGRAAPRERLDARQQFDERERLDEVI